MQAPGPCVTVFLCESGLPLWAPTVVKCPKGCFDKAKPKSHCLASEGEFIISRAGVSVFRQMSAGTTACGKPEIGCVILLAL